MKPGYGGKRRGKSPSINARNQRGFSCSESPAVLSCPGEHGTTRLPAPKTGPASRAKPHVAGPNRIRCTPQPATNSPLRAATRTNTQSPKTAAPFFSGLLRARPICSTSDRTMDALCRTARCRKALRGEPVLPGRTHREPGACLCQRSKRSVSRSASREPQRWPLKSIAQRYQAGNFL